MGNKHLVNLGYFFIWGDFLLVMFLVHSLFVSPMNVEMYFSEYLQLALYFFNWIKTWGGFFDWWIGVIYTWPAAFLFFIRYFISTSIGIWLVRKYS
tara:strand:+ start:214 stop:501 length:288 start_codon:yes stop_codon:yes gene_type:complete